MPRSPLTVLFGPSRSVNIMYEETWARDPTNPNMNFSFAWLARRHTPSSSTSALSCGLFQTLNGCRGLGLHAAVLPFTGGRIQNMPDI